MVRTRKAIYVGNQEVKRRYIGNKLIFENLGDMDERNMITEVETGGGEFTDIYFDSEMVVGKTYVLSFDFEFPEHVTIPRQFRIFGLQGAKVTNTNLTSLGIFSLPSGREGSVYVYFTLNSEYTGTVGNPLQMRIHHGTYGGEYVEATLSNLKLVEGSA